MSNSVNPEMLILARETRGLTQSELAEAFEKEERITLPDGTGAIKRESMTVNCPFETLGPYQETQSPEPAIYYDRNNFTSRATFNQFLQEIENSSDLEFLTGETIRKA